MKEKLIDILEPPISGVWGEEPNDDIGFPVLRTTNFTNEGVINYNDVTIRKLDLKKSRAKFLKRGDIIIEKSGGSDKQPVGRVVYFEGQENTYLFNNFTAGLRVRDHQKWNSRYVFFALFSNYKKGGTALYQNRTTGLHNLQLANYLSHFYLNELSLIEQDDFVSLIDKIDNIIARRKQQLEKLDLLVKAKFDGMFGNSECNTKNFPVLRLDGLCKVGSSKRIYKNELTEKGVEFLRVSDLNARIDNTPNCANLYIAESTYACLKETGMVPRVGDILLTSRGTLGRCYIITEKDRFYFQDGMITWLSYFSDSVISLYVKYFFDTVGMKKQIRNLQAGSTVAYLSIDMVKRLELLVPPLELQNEFAHFVEHTEKIKTKIKLSLEKLELLKQSLLQKYFG